MLDESSIYDEIANSGLTKDQYEKKMNSTSDELQAKIVQRKQERK